MKSTTYFDKKVFLIALLLNTITYLSAKDIQKEYFDRGLVAFVRADTSVYIGWRLHKDDPQDIAFNLYRKTIGSVVPNDYIKINKLPIVNSTNYIDKRADYHVPFGGTENRWN